MKSRVLIACVLFLAACAKQPPAEPPSSVLIVTIDTLRADRVGAYGDAKARTPNLDALAQSGVVFERAYTPVPITLPAHVSIMTGLIPPAHGVRGNGSFVLGPTPLTLADMMHQAGRKTAAFIGGFPLSRRFGLARGFDVYDDAISKTPSLNYDFAERRADAVVDSAVSWMSSNPGPAFVWVHLFDPHAPYDPPVAFRTDDPYRDEIAAADAALGRLMRAWDARPGPSTVIAASDHGEAFGEHGEWSHSLFVYDTTLHVPLIVRGHGFDAGKRSTVSVSLVDVAATAAEAIGVAPNTMPGASLSGALQADVAWHPLYAETLSPRLDFGWSELRSWRDGGLKWIRAPKPELYDVTADSSENTNVAPLRTDQTRAMDVALSKALAALGEKSAFHAADNDTIERLHSLGYVQGSGALGSGADPKDKKEVARRIALATGPFADWGEAIKTYESLVAIDKENPLLNMRLADALLRSGQPQASLLYFARVVKGKPLTADPYVGYATALAQLKRFAEAKRVLESGVAVSPANGQLHYNLAEIARIEGRGEDARREYEAARADPVTADRAAARLAELR